jgi:hypothetical protein
MYATLPAGLTHLRQVVTAVYVVAKHERLFRPRGKGRSGLKSIHVHPVVDNTNPVFRNRTVLNNSLSAVIINRNVPNDVRVAQYIIEPDEPVMREIDGRRIWEAEQGAHGGHMVVAVNNIGLLLQLR